MSRSSLLALPLLFFAPAGAAQELSGKQSIGVRFDFQPTSSNALIGTAEERRIVSASVQYGRVLITRPKFSLAYEGSVTPFFQERDPTLIGDRLIFNGTSRTESLPPQRVVSVDRRPFEASFSDPSDPAFIYPFFGTETHYAFEASPIGFRFNTPLFRRTQLTLGTSGGVIFSPRDLIVDQASKVNYSGSFGGGVEFAYQPRRAVRLEYVLRHISNGNTGYLNPGIDAGVFRVTLLRSR